MSYRYEVRLSGEGGQGIVLAGVQRLLRGDFFYNNYWGGLVFGPLAIAIGAFCLNLVVFR